MLKWYENKEVDSGIVISSRVRLARNIKKYPFPGRMSKSDAENVINDVKGALLNDRTPLGSQFKFTEVETLSANEKRALMESHIISPVLVAKNESCGVLIKDDETISIMLNEEDHIRIQTILPGKQIDKAFDLADKIDNLIEESVEYAFNENSGYITACPTNIGTGLRASFMVHLPALERASKIVGVVNALSKFGITVRGTYGEGSEANGSVYQISNQITLGRSEEEIIENLKNAVKFVEEQETKERERFIKGNAADFEDKVYRSYGIITNARKISAKEAMSYLSNIREGYMAGVLDAPKPKKSLYTIMINIQPGNIQNNLGSGSDVNKRDELRAKYLRDVFSGRE
ncbi:protein arginine kinase [Anaerotignum faecicola]|nr:protein arginine kinase [Anaerotignum faecicola]